MDCFGRLHEALGYLGRDLLAFMAWAWSASEDFHHGRHDVLCIQESDLARHAKEGWHPYEHLEQCSIGPRNETMQRKLDIPSISMFHNVSICSPASLDWFTVSILCPFPCFIGLKLINMTGNGLEETLRENHLAPFNALERDFAMMSFSHFSDFSVLANQHQTRTSLNRMSMWKLMGTNVY